MLQSLAPVQHRFLIVDDHPFVVDAVSAMLDSIAPGGQVLSAPSVSRMQYHLARHAWFSAVVLDLELPDASEYQAIEALQQFRGHAPTVVFSGKPELAVARRCLELGARDFVPKTIAADRLRRALNGLIRSHSSICSADPSTVSEAIPDIPEELGFTTRQREVAELLAIGFSNKRIARRLGIAAGTVKVHVGVVLNRLGISGRAEVMAALLKLRKTQP